MKQVFLAATGLLMTTFFASCEKIQADGPMITEQRTVTGFSGIDLRVNADVNYRQSPDYKVEVRAQDEVLEALETFVSNGKLVIKYDNGEQVWKHDGITVTVAGPDMRSMRVSGSGDIRTTGSITASDMELDISGSGDITITDLATGVIDAHISGSGDIKVLQGTATEEKLRISGSGSIDLANVAARSATTRTSGSGDTRVNVSERLDVTIAGSGSVYYRGNPIISTSVSGSGKVRPQ